jgi:CSLREA domain-containing protein
MRSGSIRCRSFGAGLSAALFFLFCAARAHAATITVNTVTDVVADDGLCTFREAIVAANTNTASGLLPGECAAGSAGLDTIQFAIAGPGVHRIAPTVALQAITESIFIDGYSQSGSSVNTNPMNAGINAVILIEIYGASSGGLHLNASNSTIRGLSIHGGGDAITINGSNVTITGNFIGTNPAGTAGESLPSVGIEMLSGNNNIVGGPNPADRNLVSGYRSGSIEINSCNGTLVQGNYLGTNAAGTLGLQDLSATPFGVQTDPLSANTTIVGNLIAGNATGVAGYGNSIIQGNLIGTQKDGVTPLPNVTYGIVLLGNGHLVGGAIPAQSNTIAYNGFGVNVPSANGNRIQGNSIYSSTHLGIGLSGFSFNPLPNDACDADTQPGNLGQNYPVLTSATIAAGSVTISGTLNSVAATSYRIEFFSSSTCNASGNGEGKTYLGFTNATTNGTCDATFGPVAFPVPGGQTIITATATDPGNNTSEFSACFATGLPGASFFTVTPCRVADTRNPAGPYGGPALAANVDRTFVIGGQCGVPAAAKAVSFNFTITQPTALGDLRVFPAGGGLPLVSTLNWSPAQTRANNAIVGLGPSADVTVHPDQGSGTVHLIVDVNGYFQ